MPVSNIDVLDAAAVSRNVNTLPGLGTAADAASLPSAFSTEGKAQLGSLTETAPATDTASSGINGRLQRIAQRITTALTGIVLAAGTNLIGKVGVDQTTPGTTNGVVVKDGAGTALDYTVTNLVAQIGVGPATNSAGAPVANVPIIGVSGNVAATATTATLAGAAAKTTYCSGFQVDGSGATGASVILVTVTGLLGGTLTYPLAIPAGVTTGITPLRVKFDPPLPGSAANTAIVVNVPSFGSGNTNAAANAQGFQL